MSGYVWLDIGAAAVIAGVVLAYYGIGRWLARRRDRRDEDD